MTYTRLQVPAFINANPCAGGIGSRKSVKYVMASVLSFPDISVLFCQSTHPRQLDSQEGQGVAIHADQAIVR
jgi:hypothetical protein